ncbi:unnamed protein product [Darwinula stevensoni]|uniref:O-acyltransferase n=1 Tax=Darwinula stevensoni TaxID=69355 RepID=A0A7R8X881_9CRUS|nr:unnamed protein product [Darwinula stevensoni]CAG0883091.1 unnamed protein product [Darwinula stevensoni]
MNSDEVIEGSDCNMVRKPDTAELMDLRFRRCKSVTRAEEIQYEEQKIRKAQPDHPCHQPRDSLFSWSSGFHDFTGFMNLSFLLLLLGGLRLFLENIIKYGIRIDPSQWQVVLMSQSSEFQNQYPSLYLLTGSHIQVLFTLGVEKLLAGEWLGERLGLVLHVISLLVFVTIPIVVINFISPHDYSMLGATAVCTVYCILFLKLWSFVHVNSWCRAAERKGSRHRHKRRRSLSINVASGKMADGPHGQQELVKYPDNLTLKSIYYFICAPTLCYELNFPRSSRIRKRFLLKRILEVIIGLNVILSLFQQWIIPSVKNSLIPFSQMDPLRGAERLLKLAVPNHLLWLIWFYLFFHAFFNMIGELTCFADRNFYGDWWNSENLGHFWRSWNLPVHRWALRHLYTPLTQMGFGRFQASVAVFFLSAFFHEYLVSVPLRIFKVWAFTGMMSQLPLSQLSLWIEKKFGGRWANVMVWASVILGQPLCIMMYYHDYIIVHFGPDLLEQFSKL